MQYENDTWLELEGLAAEVVSGKGGREGDAWPRFWMRVQPSLEQWVHSPGFLGRLGNRDDYCRDLVILAWEKLQDNDYSKLRAYFQRQQANCAERGELAWRPDAFHAWLFRVFKNIGIDYVRQLPEYVRPPGKGKKAARNPGSEESQPGAYWRAVVTLHSYDRPVLETFTSAATVKQLLDFLDRSVPPRQRRAAELYHQGQSYDAIAGAIGLADRRDAERVVHRSLDRVEYRRALELWSQNYSNQEIARALGLDGPEHALRLVKAAKQLLKRHFRP